MRYTIVSSSYNMSLRKDHTTSSALIDALPKGSSASGDEIFEVTQNTATSRAGDKWLHVKTMANKAVDGWMAIIHMGKEYCKVLEEDGETKAPAKPVKIVAVYDDGSTEEFFPA